MEKTVLQQLIDKWESEKGSYIPNAPIFQCFINDAKQMIKEEEKQIINSYLEGADIGQMFNNEGRAFITDAKEYYKQTFKSK